MKIIVMFFALSIVNVILSTVRTLVTVKGNKVTASLMSGAYFAFYNIMLVYTVADFSMLAKCVITFISNVIGVFTVKWIEEKSQKDKLWKVETCVKQKHCASVKRMLSSAKISFNLIALSDGYTMFNIFCQNKAQSHAVREILKPLNAKYTVIESKAL